jgi:hypothetical protein
MPLTSLEDLLAKGLDGTTRVADLAVARMKSDGPIMPPPPNSAASATDIGIIEDWIASGHPARTGGENCHGTGGNGGSGGGGANCEPDIKVRASTPFEMPSTSSDEQVCFGVDLPATSDKRHITMIAPNIDNSKIIHHILLLSSPTAVDPLPKLCGVVNPDWKLLYAWGPGTPALALPAAAGLPLEADEETHFVLQIHYNNVNGLEGETDLSGLDLCTTTDLRQHDADVMACGGAGFSGIAPNATSHLDCTTDIPAAISGFLPLTIYQSWPHMHQLGAAFSSVAEHAGGSTSALAEVEDYSFEYQITYPNDVELNIGDTVKTRCTWQNDTPQAVNFGEDTGDEMCFNFVSYYPRIEAPMWHWFLPSAIADCSEVVVE